MISKEMAAWMKRSLELEVMAALAPLKFPDEGASRPGQLNGAFELFKESVGKHIQMFEDAGWLPEGFYKLEFYQIHDSFGCDMVRDLERYPLTEEEVCAGGGGRKKKRPARGRTGRRKSPRRLSRRAGPSGLSRRRQQ